MRSLIGVQTDSGLAAAVGSQHVAAVQMAALKVAQDCRWANAQRRTTVTLNAEQEAVNYPEDCGPGNIIGMSVYNQDRYYPMESRSLPTQLDTDQELIAGGDILKSVVGLPRYYEQRNQIFLYPRTDKEYPLRIEFMAKMDLPLDESVSLVDAQLIVYMAASMISKQMENDTGTQYYTALYADRLGSLRAWENAASNFALDSSADFAENESVFPQVPNWNRLPTPPVA